jgi:hypothetical protein
MPRGRHAPPVQTRPEEQSLSRAQGSRQSGLAPVEEQSASTLVAVVGKHWVFMPATEQRLSSEHGLPQRPHVQVRWEPQASESEHSMSQWVWLSSTGLSLHAAAIAKENPMIPRANADRMITPLLADLVRG